MQSRSGALLTLMGREQMCATRTWNFEPRVLQKKHFETLLIEIQHICNTYDIDKLRTYRLQCESPTENKLYGEIKLICWFTGPTDSILSKNKKILQNFDQLAFFTLFFSAF